MAKTPICFKEMINKIITCFFSKENGFCKRHFTSILLEGISQIFGLEVSLSLVDADHLIITQMSPYQLISYNTGYLFHSSEDVKKKGRN
jgi:hypothetical protein